jgi:hypothetical protein
LTEFIPFIKIHVWRCIKMHLSFYECILKCYEPTNITWKYMQNVITILCLFFLLFFFLNLFELWWNVLKLSEMRFLQINVCNKTIKPLIFSSTNLHLIHSYPTSLVQKSCFLSVWLRNQISSWERTYINVHLHMTFILLTPKLLEMAVHMSDMYEWYGESS